ncbi:MAG: GC-type dockerin domain-anchored protein [Phycisphaerales bacterium]
MNRIRLVAAVSLCAVAPVAMAQGVTHDLVLWLRADVGVTAQGGAIGGWADSSPAGHGASQVNGFQQPTLVAEAINGMPAARFDGDDFLDLTGQVLTSDRYTIVSVVNDLRSDGGFKEVFSNWAFNNTLTSVFFGTTAFDPVGVDSTRARLTDDVGGANQGQGGVGAIVNRSNHFIFTGVSGEFSARVLQNRVLVAQRETPIPARNFTTPYVIGRQGQLGGEYWRGDIAEVLVFNAELDECELSLVYDYLNSKYGLAPCAPVFGIPLAGGLACPGGTLTLTGLATNGVCAEGLTYRWQRRSVSGVFVDLVDGAEVAGSGTPSLTLLMNTSTAGLYRLSATNSCGTSYSNAVEARVCPGDFDCSNSVDGDDVISFFAAWDAGLIDADLTGDGGVDGDDVIAFFGRWDSGC